MHRALPTSLWTVLPLVGSLALVASLAPRLSPDDGVVAFDWTPTSEEVTVLVDVADHLSAGERASFVASLPGNPRLNSEFSEAEGLYRLSVGLDEAIALLSALNDHPNVEFVEAETYYEHFGTTPNDPLYPFQWHFEQINLEPAWSRADGRGAVVAVIDTGVAYADDRTGRLRQVVDLAGTRFVPGYDFVDDDEAPFDEHGHGTHVAGTIAQTTNNGYGVAGIAPGASVMPIRVLDRNGRGSTADIAESVRFAADNGAHIINMSLGGPMPSRILQDAIDYATRKGVTVIAAAGNAGSSRPSYPAAYPNVIAVAATQYDRSATFYSNRGKHISIAAPGGNTRVDQNGDGRPDGVMQETLSRENPSEHEFALYMGTSMASPHVAGVAALLYQQGITRPDRVRAILESSASKDVPGYSADRYGAGLLDAERATAIAATRVQAPRAALALALTFFTLGLARRRFGVRPLAPIAVAGVAAFAATGLALPLLIAGWIGFDGSAFAHLATSPLRWIGSVAGARISETAVVLSAAPVLATYALLGGDRGRLVASLVVGAMLGMTTLVVSEAIVPLTDVRWIPGAGLLDRLWLIGNGVLALALTAAAARRRLG